jgi:hypothetical protein
MSNTAGIPVSLPSKFLTPNPLASGASTFDCLI